MAELRNEHMIVSGSVALYTMLGIVLGGRNGNKHGWHPHDINVYVPVPNSSDVGVPFMTYMVIEEGYRPIPRRFEAEEGYMFFPEVKHVISLQKGQLRMDVII